MNLRNLIRIANEIDAQGHPTMATELDNIIKSLAVDEDIFDTGDIELGEEVSQNEMRDIEENIKMKMAQVFNVDYDTISHAYEQVKVQPGMSLPDIIMNILNTARENIQ